MINTVEEYIKEFPEEIQLKLQEIRNIIKEVVPENTIEKISWSMPTFYLNGNLIHFAAHKSHLGLYPGASGVEMFLKESSDYKTSKGAIQLPYDKPFPKEIIQKVVKARVLENK